MKIDNAGKAGANGGEKTAGKNTGNADLDNKRGKAGESVEDADEIDDAGTGGDGKGKETPKGKFMTDDDINAIVQRRLDRASKKAEDDAKLTETQRLEKDRDDAIHKVRVSDARDEFIVASKIDYGKASRLFKTISGDLEFDDKGKVTNLADVIKTVKADWPEFFKPENPGKGDLSEGNGDKGKATGSGMNDLIRRGRK